MGNASTRKNTRQAGRETLEDEQTGDAECDGDEAIKENPCSGWKMQEMQFLSQSGERCREGGMEAVDPEAVFSQTNKCSLTFARKFLSETRHAQEKKQRQPKQQRPVEAMELRNDAIEDGDGDKRGGKSIEL